MKLLPHTFKWIGLTIYLLGVIVGFIDEGRQEFIEGFNEGIIDDTKIEFVRLMPEMVSQVGNYAILLGLLTYILSKNKREDEFIQKLRYESAFIVFVISILLILILHLIHPSLIIEAHTVLSAQMIFYLLIRMFKRQVILEN
jgi:hypothetical protein